MPFLLLDQVQEREIVPGYHARFVHSEHMSLAYLTIEAGAPLPEHTHPHEQVTNVIEGQLELTIAGETSVLTPGKVAVIPPNTPHSGRALTPCRAIDVFHPVREEYR
jgi:quercetin dioxygenase-like cupin family protein